MSNVYFTKSAINSMIANISTGSYGLAQNSGTAFLYIMTGAIPPKVTMQTATPVYFTSTRASDVLIKFTMTGGTLTGNTLAFNDLAYLAASASGTATWCAIVQTSGGGVQTIIFGDVTDGSGSGFLQLNSTAIQAGTIYRVTGMKVSMPIPYQM